MITHLSKLSEVVIARDLRFGPPQSKILATPMDDIFMLSEFLW